MSEQSAFTEQEQTVLRRLAGAMIGASNELQIPGADDDKIFAGLLQRAGRVSDQLRAGMDDYLQEFGGSNAVAALSDDEFGQVAEAASAASHAFLDALVMLVAQAYYTDPRILLTLNREDRAPFPKGHTLEQGDWSILDPVKKKDAVYRDC